MIVQTNTNRIANTLSHSEGLILQALMEHLQDTNRAKVNMSYLTADVATSRSVAVGLLNKLEATGLIESKSLGRQGIVIRVINREALEEVAKAVNNLWAQE